MSSVERISGKAMAAIAAGIAAMAVLAVLAARAAAGPAELILANAGVVARTGAPIANVLADLAGAVVMGGALLAGWLLDDDADRSRAMRLLSVAAAVWTVAQLAALLTSYAVATGQPIGDPRFGSDLGVYVSTDLGAWLLTALAAAAAVTAIAAGAVGRTGARWVAAGAALALIAKAMTGHASGTANHNTATSTMMVHLLAVGVWVGGLAVLQVMPARSRDDARVIVGFSRLALVCWTALAISGVWALATRMNGPGDLLTSAYAQIGALKALILVILGGAGWAQRQLLARRASGSAEGSGSAVAVYRRLALIEVALMGIALSLAAAMSASPPPAAQDAAPTTPAEVLTGAPLPPPPSVGSVLATWSPDVGVLAMLSVAAIVWAWPTGPARTRRQAAVGGVAVLVAVVVTSGALALYGRVQTSAHLLEHLALLALVGPCAALAFGWTIDALPGRDRLPSARIWLRPAGAALLAATVPLVYATPLIEAALRSNPGHLLMIALCVAAGAGITALVRGAGTARERAVVVVAAVLPVAGGALWAALTTVLIAADWFGATGRTWARDALTDQHAGAWIVLGLAVAAGALALVLAAAGRRQSRSSASSTERSRASRSARSMNGTA